MSIELETHGHVLLMRVARPEKRNAFSLAMLEGLAAGYETLGRDPSLRVGVVTAAGDHFSAGLDLAEVGPAVAERGPQALAGGRAFDPFGVWAPRVPKPIVIALQGIAYTLSIELALAADIVLASPCVRFRQLEIGRGIVPFGGATFRAPAKLGWGNAMRFLLTAEEFGAETALRIGLVQEIVPRVELEAAALALAGTIAKQAPLGVSLTLRNAEVGLRDGEAAAAKDIASALPGILASDDAREGLASFLERREAHFTGT